MILEQQIIETMWVSPISNMSCGIQFVEGILSYTHFMCPFKFVLGQTNSSKYSLENI